MVPKTKGQEIPIEIQQQLVADYISLGSYKAVARKHGISDGTVKKYVKLAEEKDGSVVRALAAKKEKASEAVLEHIDTQSGQIMGIVDKYMLALADPAKIDKATLQNVATALGILIDKLLIIQDRARGMQKSIKIEFSEPSARDWGE